MEAARHRSLPIRVVEQRFIICRNRSQALIAFFRHDVCLEVAENPKPFAAPSKIVSIVRQTLQAVLVVVFRLYAPNHTGNDPAVLKFRRESRDRRPESISAECCASGDAGVGTVVGSDQGNFLTMGIYAPLGQPIANQIEKRAQHGAGASADNHYIRLK